MMTRSSSVSLWILQVASGGGGLRDSCRRSVSKPWQTQKHTPSLYWKSPITSHYMLCNSLREFFCILTSSFSGTLSSIVMVVPGQEKVIHFWFSTILRPSLIGSTACPYLHINRIEITWPFARLVVALVNFKA